MKKVDDALVKIIGARPAWVRPPYGSYNNAVREAAAERQQSIAMWDFDSGDSAGASTTSIKNSYKSLVSKNPATILTLNHETYSTTNSALDDVLKTLSNKGYKMVTVAECVGKSPYVSTSAPKARDSTWKC
ncbi:Carbohydrate esterase 4 protein [Tulasnella sp. 419]|nr:Carbohydrate esterase 4 protein [Tulasnella sp. 419]